MKTAQKICRVVKWHWCVTAVGLALTAGPSALGGDVHLDMLKTQTDIFTNVTVMGKSKTDIFISYSGGLGNVKISNITDRAALRALGLGGEVPADETSSVAASAADSGSKMINSKINSSAGAQISLLRKKITKFPSIRLTPNIITLFVAVVLAIYLFFCHCLKLICLKTGRDPGILIWFPILQMLPLLRAAGMPGWWFVGFFVPVVNFVVQIVWCFKIVRARGKSVWAAIGLLFPITNVAALLYLAFSDAGDVESSGNGRVTVSGPPVPAEA
ncbi:MAG: DUF5684 domain-containing protein [Verrucomicrobia bacterium]|nr:DUF5684 domain-containing protein [Verrucomicrobiota bacterium]